MNSTDGLKNSGLKATIPRLKILDIFQRSKQTHMSAEDVFRSLILEKFDIGLATVYRVGKALYELNDGQHHDHLVCLDCGHVEEFFDTEIENRQHAIARQLGFEIADHALSLYATCSKNPCPKRPSTQ